VIWRRIDNVGGGDWRWLSNLQGNIMCVCLDVYGLWCWWKTIADVCHPGLIVFDVDGRGGRISTLDYILSSFGVRFDGSGGVVY